MFDSTRTDAQARERCPIVYFHGMPGSPRELALFGDAPASIHAPDRTARGSGSEADCFDGIAAGIRARHPAGNVRIVAFSLGVRPALHVAERLGPLVAAIDLVSPAAPLETGDYRDAAGHAVFAIARRSPRLFHALVAAQAFAARHAPARFHDALFATARGADRELAQEPRFRAAMRNVLQDCFRDSASGYRAELGAYVRPWSRILANVAQPVTLWHGDADNWAPAAMARALEAALPDVVRVHRLPGLSHFSTLEVALRRRLDQAPPLPSLPVAGFMRPCHRESPAS